MKVALLLIVLAAVLDHAARADCPPLQVDIVQADPLRATLRWTPRAGAVAYFLQYNTGKFPTQLRFEVKPGEPVITAELENLTPGRTATIEFCEALAGGICPGRPSDKVCVSLIEVPAPWAYQGAEQPDPYKAVCTLREGTGFNGESVGHPNEEPVQSGTADTCCQMCAWVGSNLPYQARCTHFAFDDASGQCRYLREAGETTPVAGATSGEVRAWPRPQEGPTP